MQASYTDLILINKWELVDDRKLDVVLDHLHTLNDLTPKIRCRGRSGVDPNEHNGHCHCNAGSHTAAAVDREGQFSSDGVDEEVLTTALGALSKETIWRVKGLVRLRGSGIHILNWAFGRFELTALVDDSKEQGTVKLTVMGERGEVKRAINRFAVALNASVE